MNNSISLTKGNSVSLTKQAPSATKFLIGASWDERTTEGKDFDLDLMAVALTSHGKVRNSNDFFFYGSVRNAKLRIADANNPNKDIVTINLSEDFGGETVVNAAEIYRHNGEWKVKSVSQGYRNGIRGALGDFGLDVTD